MHKIDTSAPGSGPLTIARASASRRNQSNSKRYRSLVCSAHLCSKHFGDLLITAIKGIRTEIIAQNLQNALRILSLREGVAPGIQAYLSPDPLPWFGAAIGRAVHNRVNTLPPSNAGTCAGGYIFNSRGNEKRAGLRPTPTPPQLKSSAYHSD